MENKISPDFKSSKGFASGAGGLWGTMQETTVASCLFCEERESISFIEFFRFIPTEGYFFNH